MSSDQTSSFSRPDPDSDSSPTRDSSTLDSSSAPRRGFLARLAGFAGLSAAASVSGSQSAPAQTKSSSVPPTGTPAAAVLPNYARAMHHRSMKQSSFDRTGGNADSWPIAPGAEKEVFASEGPGIITHIWFTIAAQSDSHLKEIVLRMYWEGSPKPSVEVPVGDFFGLNLGQYTVYQSAFLNCSSVKALNSYFAMPFRRSARITVTNEGKGRVGAFYSNIDYKRVDSLPEDISYFHAQYRQATPEHAVGYPEGKELNLDGAKNHVFLETRGSGHLMGITMGVLQNTDHWMGEGDDMIFVDDEKMPAITGTGSEDYINGAWDFGGRDNPVPFAHLYNGAHIISNAERAGGRYCMYRWHADNPVTFTRYLRHTIEHGHANDRSDNIYSVGYWYQSEPYTDFPALPAVGDRIPVLKNPA